MELCGFLPMKVFATYPEEKPSDNVGNGLIAPTNRKQTEIFINLKDDHTFQ